VRGVFQPEHSGDVDLQRSVDQPLPKEEGDEVVGWEPIRDLVPLGLCGSVVSSAIFTDVP